MDIDWLIKKVCTRVYEQYPENFTFEFETGALAVDCLWRVIADGWVVRTSGDHGQQYGLPAPLDAYVEAENLLRGRRVAMAQFREGTSDLLVIFEGGIQLEIIADSSGYEPWTFDAPGIRLIALGGGGLG